MVGYVGWQYYTYTNPIKRWWCHPFSPISDPSGQPFPTCRNPTSSVRTWQMGGGPPVLRTHHHCVTRNFALRLLGCPRNSVNGWEMGYITPRYQLLLGYLLTFWDIQVDCKKTVFVFIRNRLTKFGVSERQVYNRCQLSYISLRRWLPNMLNKKSIEILVLVGMPLVPPPI